MAESADTPAGVPGGGGTAVEEMAREYEEGKRQVGRLRLFARIGSFTATLLIVVFLWSIVAMAGEMYSWEKWEPNLKAEAERLVPEARAAGNRVFGRAAPVYARLAQEKLESALPLVQESLRTELEAMGTGIAQRAGPQVTAALERLEARQWERLGHHFPSLATEAGRVEFTEKWKEVIIDDHHRLLADFDLRYGKEVIDLQKNIEGFRPNRFETWGEEQLTRHFVHLWLQLLDRHILSKDYPGDVEEVNRDR